MTLEDLIENFRIFNNLFSRTICYTENKKQIWQDSSIDKYYIDNLINYRDHTNCIVKRKILRNKSQNVFNYLI
jgi:hypothetical protein